MPFDDLLAPLFAKVQLFDGLTRAEFGPPLKRHHTGAQKAQICRGIRGGGEDLLQSDNRELLQDSGFFHFWQYPTKRCIISSDSSSVRLLHTSVSSFFNRIQRNFHEA